MKETLRKLREKNHFSQSSIAEYLNISRQMYSKYESGETEPPLKAVVSLCKLYKIPYETIIDNSLADSETIYKSTADSKAQLSISEPQPVYGSSPTKAASTSSLSPMDTYYLKKYESLTQEQKNIIGTLIDSLFSMNGTMKKKSPPHRKPGGMKGEFYMADDFDETPDCFKDYM